MTRDEYEQRKRRLEEEWRAGVELLDKAYRHQLRALELVWTATDEGPAEIPRPAAAPTPPAAPDPAAPARPARREAGALLQDVRSALARLPEVFDRNDVCEALGYEPDRSSLFRVLQELERQGELTLESRGSGQVTTLYRHAGANGSAAGV
ncbi:MAG: hypothetical protein QOF89_1690 [Acidobacteriota bacterium]|jgi:hypothetical protein|nr:hypothetical protein [Acidobacteriota bacterium]